MELLLIVEASEPSTCNIIDLEGRKWCLTEPLDITSPGSIPSYTCISYIWGPNREWNKRLRPGLISDKTISALETAIRSSASQAFWTDFFCVPANGPSRQATLESMGYIYSRASEVIVVLSQHSFDAMEQMSKDDRLDEQSMTILEQDPWIKSVWTYQEVINSQKLSFTCESPTAKTIDGDVFLNRIGYSNMLYTKSHPSDPLAVYTNYPNLNALEDLVADWMISSYTRISALQVLSNLDRRTWAVPQNYFYAAIGAITQKPVAWGPAGASPIEEISNTFIGLCEEKNDYSFIYSSTERSEESGRRWRPKSGMIHSVLPWHLMGEGQRGHLDAKGVFWLDQMLRLPISTRLGEPGKQFIAHWLCSHVTLAVTIDEDDAQYQSQLIQNTHYKLSRIGFTGPSTPSITDRGLFFPHSSIPIPTTATASSNNTITILVATGVQWVLGAPGLAAVVTEGLASYLPGVFVGEVRGGIAGSVRMDNAKEFVATGEKNTYAKLTSGE